jgi:hypothetical protein
MGPAGQRPYGILATGTLALTSGRFPSTSGWRP